MQFFGYHKKWQQKTKKQLTKGAGFGNISKLSLAQQPAKRLLKNFKKVEKSC